jgi:hypothetical protein
MGYGLNNPLLCPFYYVDLSMIFVGLDAQFKTPDGWPEGEETEPRLTLRIPCQSTDKGMV